MNYFSYTGYLLVLGPSRDSLNLVLSVIGRPIVSIVCQHSLLISASESRKFGLCILIDTNDLGMIAAFSITHIRLRNWMDVFD